MVHEENQLFTAEVYFSSKKLVQIIHVYFFKNLVANPIN